MGFAVCRTISQLLKMSIQERQNRPESIMKLAAQRLLYRRAKCVRGIGMLLILPVAALGLTASVLDNQELSRCVPLVALILWFLDQQVLKRMEAEFKTEAATIQEDFDCFVLDIPWPTHKSIRRPTRDRIRQLAGTRAGKPAAWEELHDWFAPNTIPNHPILSKVHCQQMSCWWDGNLRQRWRKVLKVTLWIFGLLVLALSFATGITVAKLFTMIASNMRLVAWGRDEINGQVEAISRIDGIHRYLSDLSQNKPISPNDIRSVQDEIFEYRRSNPPVPDWFYWWKRDDQELEASTPYDKGVV